MIVLEILLTVGVVVLFAELADRFDRYARYARHHKLVQNKRDRKPKTLEGEFIPGLHD